MSPVLTGIDSHEVQAKLCAIMTSPEHPHDWVSNHRYSSITLTMQSVHCSSIPVYILSNLSVPA